MYGQASSWAEEDMRRPPVAGALARADSERRPDLSAREAMGGWWCRCFRGTGVDLAGSLAAMDGRK